MRCIVLGATGYLGTRLVPALISGGHEVRVMARTPAKLDDVPWREQVDVVQGDVTDATRCGRHWTDKKFCTTWCTRCLKSDFVDTDARAASTVAQAAADAQLSRIVYMGGIIAKRPASVQTPRVACRGGAVAAGIRRSHRRIARGRHHRCGVGKFRDVALPDRTAAGDDHAALAAHHGAADRGARRAVLPGQRRLSAA